MDLLGSALRDLLAVIEHDDMVGDLVDDPELVLADERSRAAGIASPARRVLANDADEVVEPHPGGHAAPGRWGGVILPGPVVERTMSSSAGGPREHLVLTIRLRSKVGSFDRDTVVIPTSSRLRTPKGK